MEIYFEGNRKAVRISGSNAFPYNFIDLKEFLEIDEEDAEDTEDETPFRWMVQVGCFWEEWGLMDEKSSCIQHSGRWPYESYAPGSTESLKKVSGTEIPPITGSEAA